MIEIAMRLMLSCCVQLQSMSLMKRQAEGHVMLVLLSFSFEHNKCHKAQNKGLSKKNSNGTNNWPG